MKNYLAEFVTVLVSSKRTMLAVIFGLIFFVGINLVGDFMVSRVQTTGVMSAFYEAIAEKINHRYDKVALFALLSFAVLAVKSFIRDRKRLYSML